MKAKKIGAIAIALGLTMTAQADVITFNDNMGSGDFQVDSFDWTPGSAVAFNANATSSGVIEFDVLAHSKLGTFQLNNSSVTPGGLDTTYEITFVTGFRERAGVNINDANFDGNIDSSTLTFLGLSNDPNAINFFEIRIDPLVDASDINGTGYNNGTLILSGNIVNSSGNFTSYFDTPDGTGPNVNPNPALNTGANGYNLLDNFGADSFYIPGQETVDGSGGTQLFADVTFQDNSYFKSNISSLPIDLLFSTLNNVPFGQANPSEQFWNGSSFVTPFLGTVNGLNATIANSISATAGKDVEFQSDASNSFKVPEPSILGLFGISLLGIGFMRKKSV